MNETRAKAEAIRMEDGIHVTLPIQLDDNTHEDREYIITKAWVNGSGVPWCDAHYYVHGRKCVVYFWPRIERLAKIALELDAIE